MAFDTDLFVIGGGSGGVRAARIAALAGAQVEMAEEYRVGGTCVIRGCVPKKLMVFAADFPAAIAEARAYGWGAETGDFDWPGFRRRLDAELDRLERIYRANLERAGVRIHDSRAVVKDAHTVALADGREIRARHILIATGGQPFVPDLPGAELAMTSNDVFRLETLPRSMLIVGGGYIACEFAGILAGLGVRVTLAFRGAQILRGFDGEAAALAAAGMAARGIDLRPRTEVTALARGRAGLEVESTTGTGVFDAVLYATGRRPLTEGLGLEAAGVRLTESGAVEVDEWSQTCVPSIYAVGDVTDRVALTPVAIRDGHAFADTVFGADPRPVDHALIPSAVFTRPEIGTVGLTEEEGRARGGVDIYAASFRPMRTAFIDREDRVLMKLVVCRETQRVLGCHIVAPEAGEMIQLAAIAVKMGATKAQFDATCAVHPTMAEELVTMKTPSRSW